MTNAEEIPRIVAHAYKTAISGAPGPVVVDFPIDVLFHPPRMSALAYGSVMRPAAAAPGPDPASLDALVQLWKAARRPVIISGTGAARTTTTIAGKDKQPASPLLALAEATSTPVFYSQKYSPALPIEHPLRGGPVMRLAALPYIGKQRPDFVLLLGSRTGFMLGGRSGVVIPNGDACKLVQVDLDGAEIGRSLPVDLGIVSDANNFISALLEKIKSGGAEQGIDKHEAWIQDIQDVKNLPSPHANDSEKGPDGRLHPYHTIRAIYESIPAGSIVVIDGGEAGVWAGQNAEVARPACAITATGYLGFLGNGWGYSLGAAVAAGPETLVLKHPRRRVCGLPHPGA